MTKWRTYEQAKAEGLIDFISGKSGLIGFYISESGTQPYVMDYFSAIDHIERVLSSNPYRREKGSRVASFVIKPVEQIPPPTAQEIAEIEKESLGKDK